MRHVNPRFRRAYYASLNNGKSNCALYGEDRLEKHEINYAEIVMDALRVATGFTRRELEQWQNGPFQEKCN